MTRCNCTTAVCMAHPNFWVCKTPGCENGPAQAAAAPTVLRDMSDAIDGYFRDYAARRWAKIEAACKVLNSI